MTAITLDQADRLIDAILARGAALDCRPLSVIVVEPGCKVKAFKKEDGASMIRFEMAFGKAYAALAMGRSSKLVKVRAEEKPIFMRYLLSATGDQIFPEGGGLQIRDAAGEVIGARRRDRRHRGARRGARRLRHPRGRAQDRRGLRGPGPAWRRAADQHIALSGERLPRTDPGSTPVRRQDCATQRLPDWHDGPAGLAFPETSLCCEIRISREDSHGGSSTDIVVVAALLTAAAIPPMASRAAPTLDYDFFKVRVEPVFLQKRPGLTRCYVCHAESNNAFRLERLTPGAQRGPRSSRAATSR